MFQVTRQDFHGMMFSGDRGASPILSNNMLQKLKFFRRRRINTATGRRSGQLNQTRNLFGGSDQTFKMLTYELSSLRSSAGGGE